jgi:poly(hydroxyalkanoate) depolymerase family esterase
VRLGLLRGQWRRGRVKVSGIRFYPGHLALRTWRYGLYAPAGLRDHESAPLIVLLHGCKQRALNFAYAAGWTHFADRARVRLLCPNQRRLANLYRCWNWFHPTAQGGQGELSVIMAMLDDAAKKVRIDAGAVSAVGISAGGALAALLAFHYPARFRAVATVAAPPLLGNLNSFNALNAHRVMRGGIGFSPLLALGARRQACAPLLVVHGTADDVVHPRCAQQLLAQAAESMRRAGIPLTRDDAAAQLAGTTVTEFRAQNGVLLRAIEIKNLGHAWTGGPGGHPYCEREGPPLTALCAQFLRETGSTACP